MNAFEKASAEIYDNDTGDCENVIEFQRNSDTATVTFTQGRYIGKILKLAEKYPDEVKIIAKNADGSILAHIPVSYIHITKFSKSMTDEQKQAASERMKKIREKSSKSIAMYEKV